MPQVRFGLVHDRARLVGAVLDFYFEDTVVASASVTTDQSGLAWASLAPGTYRVYATIDGNTSLLGRYKVKAAVPAHSSGSGVFNNTFVPRFQAVSYNHSAHSVVVDQFVEWSV